MPIYFLNILEYNLHMKWDGYTFSAMAISRQIQDRWGFEESCKYDPKTNCMTYTEWKKRGKDIRIGEKPLILRLKKREVKLYYYLQVNQMLRRKDSNLQSSG